MNITTAQWDGSYCRVHFTDEEIEAQKSSKVTQLRGGRAGVWIQAAKVQPTNVTTSHNAQWIIVIGSASQTGRNPGQWSVNGTGRISDTKTKGARDLSNRTCAVLVIAYQVLKGSSMCPSTEPVRGTSLSDRCRKGWQILGRDSHQWLQSFFPSLPLWINIPNSALSWLLDQGCNNSPTL